MKQAGNIQSGCCLLDFYCALLSEITVICAFSGGSKPLPYRFGKINRFTTVFINKKAINL